MGAVIGLYTDFLFSNKIGISAILLFIVGFSGGYLDKKFSKESKMTIMIIGTLVTALYETIFYLYNVIVLSVELNILSFLYTLVIELIYNILLVIILYPLIHKLGDYAENVFKNRDVLPRYF